MNYMKSAEPSTLLKLLVEDFKALQYYKYILSVYRIYK